MRDPKADRQSFLGRDLPALLTKPMIGVVGLSGGGSHVVQQLAHIGFPRYTLFDPKTMEEKHLHRVVGATQADVEAGILKVEVGARLVRGIRPRAIVRAHACRWQDRPAAIRACDVVVGCADTFVQGRAEWEEKAPLFRVTEYSMAGNQKTSLVRELPGEDADFWSKAEVLVVQALRAFAHGPGESIAAAFRRGLFAEDAARGLAFIDVCRLRLDVVLMNPPFGSASVGGKKYIEQAYPRTKNDLYAAFVERGIQWLHPRAKLGAITSRTGFFLSSFQRWREEILLKEAPPTVFADLGHGVMDAAMVESAAYCLEVVA